MTITRLLAALVLGFATVARAADVPKAEQVAMQRLLAAEAWPLRAVAALRLERYDDATSAAVLTDLLGDAEWQVRAFAVRSLGRRRVPASPTWFVDEHDPRVLRCALRHRYELNPARLARGVETLAKRGNDDRMLAAELAAASGDERLAAEAREIIKKLILRMSRAEAGALSPRLAVLTGTGDLRKRQYWRRWAMRDARDFELQSGIAIPEHGSPPPSLIAQLPPERFAALAEYLDDLGTRRIDLVVCLDCTASMSGELTAAQAGIDDLILFVNDVAGTLRFGLVAYRDRRDEFETKGWDLTADLAATR
ncbi:MAG: HEAT repeat domain-containing protein, partial [Planctomycetota bacterium]